jgi:hypothetical protein
MMLEMLVVAAIVVQSERIKGANHLVGKLFDGATASNTSHHLYSTNYQNTV